MTVVPTNRLLIVLAAVLLPSGLAAAAAPSWSVYAALFVVACMAAAVLDAIVSRHRLRGVTLQLPEVLRLVKGRPSFFNIEIGRTGRDPNQLRLGLVFPRAIAGNEEAATVLSEDGARFQMPWQALPLERGSYRITEARLETSSAAGLWAIREAKQVNAEFRVYPNLLADRKTAASLLISRSSSAHVFRQVGQGREFEKLREYIAGDTFNDIHWRATAHHGRPVTKVFQVERTQEVYAVLDCSRLSGRFAGSEPAIERYLTAALLLGLAVQKEGDLFGVIAFDDQVRTIVRAAAGRAHFGTCRDALFAVKSKRVSPDYRELSQFIRTRLRKRALFMVLTDLDDTAIAEEFEANIAVLRRTHIVTANMIRPAGVTPVFQGAPVKATDEIFDRVAGHLRWHALEQTRRRLAARGIPLSLLSEHNSAAELVSRYRQIKGRQLL